MFADLFSQQSDQTSQAQNKAKTAAQMSTAKAVVKTTEKEKTGKKVSPAAANDVPVKFNEPVRADPLLQLFGGPRKSHQAQSHAAVLEPMIRPQQERFQRLSKQTAQPAIVIDDIAASPSRPSGSMQRMSPDREEDMICRAKLASIQEGKASVRHAAADVPSAAEAAQIEKAKQDSLSDHIGEEASFWAELGIESREDCTMVHAADQRVQAMMRVEQSSDVQAVDVQPVDDDTPMLPSGACSDQLAL